LSELAARAAERFGLGALAAPPERRHGGVNGLWRVRTDRGEFAVHAMQPRPAIVERCEAVMAVELAAAGAGVRLAVPVPDPATGRAAVVFAGTDEPVVVHEWVPAEPVHVDRCPPELYRRLGASVALVHGLDLGPGPPDDTLYRRTSATEWTELAGAARDRGFGWADALAGAAGELEAAIDELDGWDATSGDTRVLGHRDLTSQNVLDLDGTPVLIDWEDTGPIDAGNELGRTALDNLGRDGVLDDERLRALLAGYAAVRPLPPIGRHWCSLWIRGLVVFADHCARSCIAGAADESLLRLQSSVVEATVPELRRRIAGVPSLVDAFERAAQGDGGRTPARSS
jgi:Ser/Thr protein kinase RdoA (MazF antagonist)